MTNLKFLRANIFLKTELIIPVAMAISYSVQFLKFLRANIFLKTELNN